MPANTILVLGPALDSVIEPIPAPVDPATAPVAGRRQVSFQDKSTTPGGNVHLQVLPPLLPTDALPINVYAFFSPATTVPAAGPLRTPDWFFKSGHPSGSVHIGVADPKTGAFTITVPGVKPSLSPYHVQTIIEYPVS